MSQLDKLQEEVTGVIEKYPNLSVYGIIGMLEVLKFALIENLERKEDNESESWKKGG